MQFERIRKSHKKEVLIGGLVVLGIVSAITLVTTRAKYKVTQNIPLVSGTINYKPYDFKIMAMYQQNDSGTYTEINEMPSSGYIVNEEKTYCTTDNQTEVKGKIKTIDGNVAISNLSKSDKCYLYFDVKKITIPDIIAANNPKTTTPDFNQVATTDEGVFKVADGMYGGISYYWRGAVTNNYVKFANFCWRIVRINGDGSIRLIYDGTTCHANGVSTTENSIQPISGTFGYAYNTNYNNSSYVGWTYSVGTQRTLNGTASNAKTQLESWYTSNLASYASKIADGKYCNDRNTGPGGSTTTWSATGTTFYYATYNRINTGVPTLSCLSSDVYALKVGLITADEVMYAGGKISNNSSYYLYNGENYWTMSPRCWTSNASVFVVGSGGAISGFAVYNAPNLRPVINLKADTLFTGAGTQINPYIVS